MRSQKWCVYGIYHHVSATVKPVSALGLCFCRLFVGCDFGKLGYLRNALFSSSFVMLLAADGLDDELAECVGQTV